MSAFKEIYIDRAVLDTPLAKRVQKQVPADAVRIVSGREEALLGATGKTGAKPGFKHRLFVTREKARMIKPCPGTPGMRCCNLFVLNHIIGCPYDCTYCFLQAYQNTPFITLYANLEKLEEEIAALRARNPGRLIRVCTGELADSLALDSLADAAAWLVERFAGMDNVLLELKTKSARIGHLLDLDHRGRTALSWSLNSEAVAAREELGAPLPRARLAAAAKAVKAGYPVAFHFDPIIRYPGWREGYAEVVDGLFRVVPPESVRWISLGGFRFTPEMKSLIMSRFARTRLFYEELLPCPDGKMRYFSKHRIDLYRALLAMIREKGGEVPVYLCMEADYVWRKVFGHEPEASRLLEPLFSCRS